MRDTVYVVDWVMVYTCFVVKGLIFSIKVRYYNHNPQNRIQLLLHNGMQLLAGHICYVLCYMV